MSSLPPPAAPDALDSRQPDRQTAPVVVASPHSGSLYPAKFLVQAAVSLAALRRAEDAFVDELFGAAPCSECPCWPRVFRAPTSTPTANPTNSIPGCSKAPCRGRSITARPALPPASA